MAKQNSSGGAAKSAMQRRMQGVLDLNSEIAMLTAAKATMNQLLAEARSNLANDNEELNQKYTQKGNLD